VSRGDVVAHLLRSREPSIRWKARVHVLGEDADSGSLRRLQGEIRTSRRTRVLLRERTRSGPRKAPLGVYWKWTGDHWVLAHLADLGYPAGDPSLRPRIQRALDVWLAPNYFREYDAAVQKRPTGASWGVPRLEGRYRRCASQQGNALWYATALGPFPEECGRLAERLVHWQWPDGGWNCDPNPSADTSSFGETLIPMMALHAYGTAHRNVDALEAARRAAEVFLRRRLYRRVTNGKVIHWEFARLHYPLYWHYDFLGGLKAMAEMGALHDPRCTEALDLLESKELPGGGWPAEGRYYDLPGERARRGTDSVLWGRNGPGLNEWVTVDALAVLRAAGRFAPDAGGSAGR